MVTFRMDLCLGMVAFHMACLHTVSSGTDIQESYHHMGMVSLHKVPSYMACMVGMVAYNVSSSSSITTVECMGSHGDRKGHGDDGMVPHCHFRTIPLSCVSCLSCLLCGTCISSFLSCGVSSISSLRTSFPCKHISCAHITSTCRTSRNRKAMYQGKDMGMVKGMGMGVCMRMSMASLPEQALPLASVLPLAHLSSRVVGESLLVHVYFRQLPVQQVLSMVQMRQSL